MIKWVKSKNGLYEVSERTIKGIYLLRMIGEDKIQFVDEATNSISKWHHDISQWEE